MQLTVLDGAQGRNRTADTRIFSFVIFQKVILLRIGRVRAHLFHPIIFIRFITFSIVSRWHGCCTANVPCTLAMTVMGYWLRRAFMSTHLAAIPWQSKVRSGAFTKSRSIRICASSLRSCIFSPSSSATTLQGYLQASDHGL